MRKIACMGPQSFCIGFQLAGIRSTIEANDKTVLDKIHGLKKQEEIGVVIVDEALLETMDSHDRTDIEDSVDPVFIPLSTEASSDSIRKLIIKSIGVDVWKGD